MPAYPDSIYLEKIGRFVFAVTALEGLALGDLERHAGHLPAKLTVAELAGRTTRGIGNLFLQAHGKVASAPVAHWVETAGRVLVEVGEWRNDLLHSRPATVDGKQILLRWLSDRAEAMNDAWLDLKILALEDRYRVLDAARVTAQS